MNELWSETWDRIRRYPLLCLPVMWAATLSYLWGQFERIFREPLIFALLQTRTHSVLGAEGVATAEPGSMRYALALVVAGAYKHACVFAGLLCFFVALMMTAKILQRSFGTQYPIRLLSWKMVRVAVITYIGFGFLMLPLLMVIYRYSVRTHGASRFSSLSFLMPTYLIEYSIIAYFLVPAVLGLLMEGRGIQPSKLAVSTARSWALITGAVVAALTTLFWRVPSDPSNNMFEIVGIALFREAVTSLPYIPLFVALSLIATKDEGEDKDIPQYEGPALSPSTNLE